MRLLFILSFSLLIQFFSLSSWSTPNATSSAHRPHVDVELIAENTSAQPGGVAHLGLYFQMEKGWHIYWKNPGDSGEPPKLSWSFSPESQIQTGDIQWPTPLKVDTPPLMQYGYPEAVLLPVDLAIPKSETRGEIQATVKVRWLVCETSCIPGQATLTLPLVIDPEPPARSAQAGFFDEARVRIPKPQPKPEWKLSALAKEGKIELRILGQNPEFSRPPIFFPSDAEIIENAAKTLFSQDPKTGALLSLTKSEQLKTPPNALRGVIDSEYGFYEVSIPLKDETGPALLAAPDILKAVFFAFLGGLILNLMPCVFPVLSIKALSILNASGQTPKQLRNGGLVYGLGILVSLWIFAAFTLALRSGGSELGWGFQLQSPFFIATLSLLIYLMALNLLGVFEISIGGLAGAGSTLTQAPGAVGSFFTGVLAVVVATPCTAPFMGSAMGLTLGQPGFIVILVFTFLGVGLAAPYILLCYFPQLESFLPRPGRWMESLRQFLSFPLLATVIWLVWIYGLETSLEGTAYLLVSILVVSFGAWILGRWPGRKWSFAGLALMIFIAGWSAYQGTRLAHAGTVAEASAPGATEIPWQKYSRAKLDEVLTQGHPVFVDFTAAWCVTCKVNEHIALDQSEVKEKIKTLGVIPLRGDWTDGDAEITQTLTQFGRNGVPLYLLYSGKKGDNPVILPQILTVSEVLKELATVVR